MMMIVTDCGGCVNDSDRWWVVVVMMIVTGFSCDDKSDRWWWWWCVVCYSQDFSLDLTRFSLVSLSVFPDVVNSSHFVILYHIIKRSFVDSTRFQSHVTVADLYSISMTSFLSIFSLSVFDIGVQLLYPFCYITLISCSLPFQHLQPFHHLFSQLPYLNLELVGFVYRTVNEEK